jgi:hypothetical protein
MPELNAYLVEKLNSLQKFMECIPCMQKNRNLLKKLEDAKSSIGIELWKTECKTKLCHYDDDEKMKNYVIQEWILYPEYGLSKSDFTDVQLDRICRYFCCFRDVCKSKN